jgi:hypothetical protein
MLAALITKPLEVQLFLYLDSKITRRLLDVAIILFAVIMIVGLAFKGSRPSSHCCSVEL